MDKDKLDAVTYLLPHAVMTNSTQRPGSVANLTIEEFNNTRLESQKEEICWCSGPIDTRRRHRALHAHLNYHKYVRPQQLGIQPSNLFFLRHGGKELKNMAARVVVQAKRFNFTFINSTELRKTVSTEATKNLKPTRRGLISKQINHSRHVEDRFYNKDLHTTKSAMT